MFTYEEEPEELEDSNAVEGDDHYAKFYRYICRTWSSMSPTEYKKTLRNLHKAFYEDESINEFLYHLAEYIEDEIRQRTNLEIRVDYTPIYGEENSSYFMSFVKVFLGGKERYVLLVSNEIVHNFHIADSRSSFNNIIEHFIKTTINEAQKVAQDINLLNKHRGAQQP